MDARDELQISEEQADAERRPDLGEDGVFRGAEEALELEVLLEPLEEQLDLPARLVEVGDGLCREMLDVGEKDVFAAGLGAGIADEAQRLHRHLARGLSGEGDAPGAPTPPLTHATPHHPS